MTHSNANELSEGVKNHRNCFLLYYYYYCV